MAEVLYSVLYMTVERGMLVLLWVVGSSGNVKGLPIFLRWNNIGT